MKLLNYKAGERTRLAVKCEQGIIDVEQMAGKHGIDVPRTMEEVIAGGKAAMDKLAALMGKDVELLSEASIEYAPCLTNPEKILCVGLNYASHQAEVPIEKPAAPALFSKFNNALAAHRQPIMLPKTAERFDYEAELVIVIGKEAANISKEAALSYVFGYTVGNDFSARDLQFRTSQWLLGKTCDSFAPIGPYLVTADEINPSNLDISCKVNGVLRQSGNTRDLIYDCADIVSYISQYMTLKPGDIIFTGTPSGVILGYPEEKQHWLKPGDEIVVTIENIGSLVNILK